MSLLHARGWVGHDVGDHVMYALGFGAGAALWFVLLLRTLTRLRSQFSPTVIPMLSRIAGGVFLLFAALLTWMNTRGLKLGKTQAPVRVAVTGRTVGLPLFESLELLGADRTLTRLRAARIRLLP